MTLLNNIEKLNPRAAAEIKACLQPIRVGPRTIRAMRRAWTVHDIAAIDLILQELGCRLVPTDDALDPFLDANTEPRFQVVPVPMSERPPISGDIPCETCGHWSSQLLQGMCPSCRDRFHINVEQSDG